MLWRVTIRDAVRGREFIDFVTADTQIQAHELAASVWSVTGWVTVEPTINPCHQSLVDVPAVSQEIAVPA